MNNPYKRILTWLIHILISYVLFAVLFEIAFYQDGLIALYMAMKFVLFIQVPGILITRYVFGNRFSNVETVVIGTCMGLVIIPFMVYVINIFEILHTRTLSFLAPVVLAVIFFVLCLYKKPENSR